MSERIVEIPFVLRNIAPEDQRILDVGCCESVLPFELAHLGYEVWAIDQRPYPLTHPNLNFVQGDICESGFASNFFDGVVCLSTLEHIGLGYYGDAPHERGDLAAVNELWRVLKPGGKLLFTAPFGVPRETWQRVYSSTQIRSLLVGFQLKQVRYFVKAGLNWIEAGEDQAASVDSPAETLAVILLLAHKHNEAVC